MLPLEFHDYLLNNQEIVKRIKKSIITSSYKARACHIGSALSCVEILVYLFYCKMKKDDIFIFSKASGVSALYSILADKGFFPKRKVPFYLKNYPLAHKDVPGIVHSVGSIAHGLNVACGMAYANRKINVHVLISDGEVQEGSTYEAALFANQHKLNNLHVYCDYNDLQALGRIDDILKIEHAFEFLKKSIKNFYIVPTIKGEGIDFLEHKVESHYMNLDEELYKKALCQI